MSDRRRPGRPSLDPSGTPSTSVNIRLREAEYARLCQLAKQKQTSLSAVMRHELARLFRPRRPSA